MMTAIIHETSPFLPPPPSSFPDNQHVAPSAHSPAAPARLVRRPQSSYNDTAYAGSQGLIIDDPVQLTDPLDTDPIAPSRQSLSPARQRLGARLLSAVTNAQPAAAALSRTGSLLHSRARSSIAAYVPKLNPSNTSDNRSANASPERREQRSSKFINDLFVGESAPIRLGPPVSPTKEKEDMEFIMEYRPQLTERPSRGPPRRRTTADVSKEPTSSKSASWFTRASSTLLPGNHTTAPTSSSTFTQPDKLLTLDISTALFPNGTTDPLDPSSFNDLLLNATNLLNRLQTAYREKSTFLTSLRPELDAQREEVEEAETRSRHLKLQLEDLSRKASDQETTLKEMALQLAEEKMKVQTLTDNAARTVRLVRHPSNDDENDGAVEDFSSATRPIVRRKRCSATSASDSGFESDVDAHSVFSVAASTTTTSTAADSVTPTSPVKISHFTTPNLTAEPEGANWSLPQPKTRNITPPTRLQNRAPIPLRLRSGVSVSASAAAAGNGKRLGSEGAAWATVEILRGENVELKRAVEGMRGELEACIAFVGGLRG